MNVIRRRGWEIPERLATPEHLLFDRRAFLAAGASALALAPYAAQAQRVADLANLPDPSADLYPAKRNETFKLDRPITEETHQHALQQFLRIQLVEGCLRAGAEAADPAVDGEDRRHGREADRDRHRRSHPQDDAGRAAYRHRCVEAWSMAIAWTGFPFARAGRIRQAAVVGEIRAHGNLHGSEDRAGPAAELVSLALCRRADHGGGDQRARLPGHRRLRQAGRQADGRAAAARGAVEIRLQVDQVDRALHLHRQAAEGHVGEIAGAPNTASGPTSIRRCRIRAGARRPKK